MEDFFREVHYGVIAKVKDFEGSKLGYFLVEGGNSIAREVEDLEFIKGIEVRRDKMYFAIAEIELDIIGTFGFAEEECDFGHVRFKCLLWVSRWIEGVKKLCYKEVS